MFPELCKIPFFNVMLNTYSLLLAIAFLVGLYTTACLAERDGLGKTRIYDLGLWILASALIGSRLLMVITQWDYYREHPSQLFTVDFFRSGGAFYDHFITAVIASVVVMRLCRLPWWRTADVCAPGIALGQAIGRLSCFSAGCCWGKPTMLPWGVQFTERSHEITRVPTVVHQLADPVQREFWAQQLGGAFAPLHLHPTQLYEAWAVLMIFAVLLLLRRRRRFDGQIILSYIMMYAVVRFIIELWRDDPRGSVLGLSIAQFIAIIVFIISMAAFISRGRKQPCSASPAVRPLSARQKGITLSRATGTLGNEGGT